MLLTCGIFYCRDSAETNGCGSLQTSSRVDSDVLRSRQQNIPLSVENSGIREENDRDGGNKNKKRYLSPVPE